jgi:hypothetical protein
LMSNMEHCMDDFTVVRLKDCMVASPTRCLIG